MKLSASLSTEWKRFKGQWNNYLVAAKLAGESKHVKAAIFLACVGTDAYELFQTFVFENDADREDIDKIVEAFERHCVGEVNETYERYLFNRRVQETSEAFDTFVADLRRMSRSCAYGDLEDSILRDRIVIGIRDDATRKKLLQVRKLDLKHAVDICKAAEAATMQLKEISHGEQVHAIKSSPTRSQQRASRRQQPSRADSKARHQQHRSPSAGGKINNCKFCAGQHDRGRCPAYDVQCNSCGRKGHFAKRCYRRNQSKIVNHLDDAEPSVLSLQSDTTRRRIYCHLELNGKTVRFLVDPGSTINVIPLALANELNLTITRGDTSVFMLDNTQLQVSGVTRATLSHPKTRYSDILEFTVAQRHTQPLISCEVCIRFDLIKVIESNICALQVPDVMQPIVAKYGELFDGYGELTGEVHLDVDKSAIPVRVPLRKLPVAIKDKVESELKELVDNQIIAPVTGPSAWISALLVTTKANGDIRICIDPTNLNKALRRDHYPMPVIDDVLPSLSKAKVFSIVDARHAFWHLLLDEESSALTTFETHLGKFRWLRLPYGVSPAPELFQRRMHETLAGLRGVACIADDILVYGCGETQDVADRDHDNNLVALFERCRISGLRLNRDKLKLRQSKVKFMGHVLTSDGLTSDPSKCDAIMNYVTPKDREAVSRLLGMATYLARFVPNFSEITAPLRELLRKENEFVWDSGVHGVAFDRLKNLLSSDPVLAYYDVRKDVILQCDSSQSGLGVVLLQEGKPVEYASRALTTTEQSYAQIEKELLAIVFGLERMHTYVYGRQIIIETDHKPLITIVKKPLTAAPKRLQRMLLRLQRYNFELVFRPGTQVVIADALSRAYAPDTGVQTKFAAEIASMVSVDIADGIRASTSDVTLRRIRDAAKDDDVYQQLHRQIVNGWPSNGHVPPDLQQYAPFVDELTVEGDLVLKGDRIVVPAAAREYLLERIHSSHIGINGCIRRARDAVFWPSMTAHIKSRVQKCVTCNTYQAANAREPLMSHDVPGYEWQKVGVDIFQYQDYNYLMTVDYLSGFFEVDRLSSKRISDVIYCLKQHFARHGLPETVVSDNSPFNCREFRAFAANYEFDHVTSSPRYAQSNGRVENAIKTVKRLLEKASLDRSDPWLALLDWRNTPSESSKLSPAQILMGRRTRSKLPMSSILLRSDRTDTARAAQQTSKDVQAYYYNRNVRERQPLNVGDTVRYKHAPDDPDWRKGQIANNLPHRSYEIETEDGSLRRRTSRHVRFANEPPIIPDHEDMTSSTPPPPPPSPGPQSAPAQQQSSAKAPVTSTAWPRPATTTRSGRFSRAPVRYGHT